MMTILWNKSKLDIKNLQGGKEIGIFQLSWILKYLIKVFKCFWLFVLPHSICLYVFPHKQ